MEFRVLGPLEVADRDGPMPLGGRRQRMVLAVLVLSANEVVSTDRLIADVWGDDPPASARKSLQVYVSRLRSLLGAERIESRPPGYLLRVEPQEVDAHRFSDLVAAGRKALETGPSDAADILRDALAMWRGAPLADLGSEIGIWPDIVRLDEQRLGALEDRIEADLCIGRHGSLVGELESLIGRHPLRERLRGHLMLALYQSGRQADALRAYQETRRRLGEELGIDPSPVLQELEAQILVQDPVLAPVAAQESVDSVAVPNPYKGLNAFGEEDAADFFGREALVGEMLGRLETVRFLAVIGPSGSGKSSAVRAGLVPALRAGALPGSGDWTILTVHPGIHPFEELEASLVRAAAGRVDHLEREFRGDALDLLRAVLRIAPDDGEVMLIIDQFEELFLLVEDESTRRRFIANLVEAVEDPHSRLRVAVTLRADVFDHPLEYPDLAVWIDKGQLTVPPLDPIGLEQAAVRPARRVGMSVELELAALMVADVSSQPGALPLFQYALTEVFERRDGPVLTVDGYRALGGLEGALRSTADQIYASLEPAQRSAARQTFLRMVALGEGGDEARRRVRRSELKAIDDGSGDVDVVLERFSDARLITFDRDPTTGEATVEPAHDALLSEWPRLAGWIEAARDDLRIHRMLMTETGQWIESRLHPDYLLAGARLGFFEDWHRDTTVQLTPGEAEYLEASALRRKVDAEHEAYRLEHERRLERRSASRLRFLVAVTAIAAIVAGGLAVFAIGRQREADRQRTVAQLSEADAIAQREEAERQRTAALLSETQVLAHSLSNASIANLGDDPQLSLLLALHAVDISATLDEPIARETVEALHWAFQLSGGTYPLGDGPVAVLPSPLGRRGVFVLPIDELVSIAHARVTRQLTAAECVEFLLRDECPDLPPELAGSLTEADPIQPTSLAGTVVEVNHELSPTARLGLFAESAAFHEKTGIRVVESAPVSLEQDLQGVLASGELPDLTVVVQPGFLPPLVGADLLIDLGRYVDVDELVRVQSPYLVALGSVGAAGEWPATDGRLYAVTFTLNSKSVIWYPHPELLEAGYEAPRTWDELLELSDDLVDDGHSPWCWGEAAWEPGVSGWPATDWIEDIVLRVNGPEVYDDWVAGRIPFTDPRIEAAFIQLGELVFREEYLYRGREAALTQFPWSALADMAWDPPECWLAHYPSYGAEDTPVGARTFPTPVADAPGAVGVVGGGDMIVAASDRPEVREFVQYLLGPEFGHEYAFSAPGFIAARSDFDLENYTSWDGPNLLIRPMAASVQEALANDAFRFDGSDLMPPEVGQFPFYRVMMEYIADGPDNLGVLLQRLDDAWPDD